MYWTVTLFELVLLLTSTSSKPYVFCTPLNITAPFGTELVSVFGFDHFNEMLLLLLF